MEQASKTASLTPEKVNPILLWRSTRIPAVQRIVREMMEEPVTRHLAGRSRGHGCRSPDLVLAPIEGEIEDTLATRYGMQKPVIIHMTPFSLGVGLLNDQYGAYRAQLGPTQRSERYLHNDPRLPGGISFPIYEGEELTAWRIPSWILLRIEGLPRLRVACPASEVTSG